VMMRCVCAWFGAVRGGCLRIRAVV
jgi:hypothetical protein